MSAFVPLSAWEAALLAGTTASALNFGIARAMARLLHAPASFAPFTALPILSGSFGGVFGATLAYALLIRLTPHPFPVIYGVTALVLLASVALPLRLFRPRPRRSKRFVGVTPAIAATLVGLHAVVALCSLSALRLWAG